MQDKKLYPKADTGGIVAGLRFRKTGEFRAPKKGEWFLSGAIPEAYVASNDLSSSYWILKEA